MAIVIPIQYINTSCPCPPSEDENDNFFIRRDHSTSSESSDRNMLEEDDERPKANSNTSSSSVSSHPFVETHHNVDYNNSAFLMEMEVEHDTDNDDYVMVPHHYHSNNANRPEEDENDDEVVTNPIDNAMEAVTSIDEATITTSFDPLFTVAQRGQQQQHRETTQYSGLYNLGNTCYMASALQMLASLDGFVRDLENRVPPSLPMNDSQTNQDMVETIVGNNHNHHHKNIAEPPMKVLVRDALLEVLHQLSHGVTVRPEDFKKCIDHRTGLFLGYRQQDSHEFLTTLLDLIDEEYKEKKEQEGNPRTPPTNITMEENTDTASPNVESDGKMVNDDDEQNDLEKSQNDDLDTINFNAKGGQSSLQNVPNFKETITDVACFEGGNGEAIEDNHDSVSASNDKDTADVQRSSSFINLNYDDIEELLYGESKEKHVIDESDQMLETKGEEPKYKLVGGRMNTTHVELTRYDHSQQHFKKTIEAAVATTNQDSSSNNTKSLEIDIEDLPSRLSEEAVSPVESNFTIEVRVCLTCESCKYRRSHIETFLHLSLEIGSACCYNVEDGIRKFFAPEKRDIKCEKCFHNTAMQSMEITKLPKALLFHMKRFIVDISPDYTSISYRKDQSSVSFEEQIPLLQQKDGDEEEGSVLEEFFAPDIVLPSPGSCYYALRSVVNHIGSSANCGHYLADAKRKKKKQQQRLDDGNIISTGDNSLENDDDNDVLREWTRFNDDVVTTISSTEAISNSSHTAYMIMYELEYTVPK